jgi:hypothetical protein
MAQSSIGSGKKIVKNNTGMPQTIQNSSPPPKLNDRKWPEMA